MKLDVAGFFSDIKNFFSYKRVLGVDIGTTSIKMVEVSRVADRLVIENYGMIETKDYLTRGNEAIQTSSLKIVEKDAIKLLKILIEQVKPKARRVIASMPVFGVFVVPVEMPLMSASETSKSVSYQAKQYIPLQPSEVSLDWFKAEDFENQKGQAYQRIMLTAIPNDLLKKYKDIYKGAGLSLSAIEVESQALARAILKPTDPITAIVDIGAESSAISIVEKGLVRHVAQTDFGGLALTQAMSRTLDISGFRAEELKRRRGLKGTGGEYELSTSLMPFLDVIIQECERARRTYEQTYSKKVERIALVGGGANLLGIQEYFSEQVNLKFVESQALSYFKYPAELQPAFRSLNNDYSLALGLALKAYTQ